MLKKEQRGFSKVFLCLNVAVKSFAQEKKSSILIEGAFCITIVVSFMIVPMVLSAITFSNSLLALRLADTLGMSLYNARSISPGVVQNIVNQVMAESGVNGVSAAVDVVSYVNSGDNSIGSQYSYGGNINYANPNCQYDVMTCSFLSLFPAGLPSVSSFSRTKEQFMGYNFDYEGGSYLAQGAANVEVCVPSPAVGLVVGAAVLWFLHSFQNGYRMNVPRCGYMGVLIPGTPQQVQKYLKVIKNIPNNNPAPYESSNGSG